MLGVSGGFKAKYRGTLRWPVESNVGLRVFRELRSIKEKSCPYVLLAGGRASREQGVETYLPSWGADGYFEFPNGVRVKLYNRYVYVLRPVGYKDSPAMAMAVSSLADLGIPETGEFIFALGYGHRREGDLCAGAEEVDLGVPIVPIDIKIGGNLHNYTLPHVLSTVVSAASEDRCLGTFVSTRCRT